MSMFKSVYGSALSGEDAKNSKNDGQGEPKHVAEHAPEDGKKASLHAHDDGHFSVETPEEGITHHDDYESAEDHMSKAAGHGDEFGMGHEQHAKTEVSKRSAGKRDDMSGSGM